MTVPDEAVEAAARVLWYSEKYADWGKVPQCRKEPFLNEARAALTAAAPFVAADAWDEGHKGGFHNAAYGSAGNFKTNPYRSGT
ncbi:hypothetical protein ASF74_14725 [Arthrobacter sp. Leaf145]|nr:hypothetical protein ASF74_14725 [Arthrobacter sp. Leaf145]